MARDLKFHDSWNIAHWKKLTERKYHFQLCRDVASTYQANLFRVHTLTRLPGEAFAYGKNYMEAKIKVLQKMPMSERTPQKIDERTWLKFFDLLGSQSIEYRQGHADDSMEKVEWLFPHIDPLHQGLGALLEQMVIQAWTAFEVMAEQLWTRTIKQRPKLETRTKAERRDSNPRSRSKIPNLYRFTFRNDNDAILRILQSKRVHSLAIARNVLVHSGGRIDNWFIRDRKGMTPLKVIRGKRPGYRIAFTGRMVRHLIDPVTPLGFDLVRAVDKWLFDHR